MRSRLVRLARLLVWLLLALGVLVVAVRLLVPTDWGRARLRPVIERQAAQFIDGQLRIGRLEGSVFGDAILHDVQVIRDGRVVLSIAKATVRYRLLDLVSSAVLINDIELVSPTLTVTQHDDGWRVEGLLIPESDPDEPISDRTFHAERATITGGHIDVRPINRAYDLREVSAELGVAAARDLHVDVRRFSGVEVGGNTHITSLTTQVTGTDDRTTLAPFDVVTSKSRLRGSMAWLEGGILEADIESDRVTLTEWRPYVDVLEGIDLAPALRLRLEGPLTALRVMGPIDDPVGGKADVDLVMNTTGVFSARGTATVARFDVAPWFVRPEWQTRLNGVVRFDLRNDAERRGITGTYTATLTRSTYTDYVIERGTATGAISLAGVTARFDARAYGAASAGDLVYVNASSTTTVKGRLTGGNPALLPAFMEMPPLLGDINGTFTLVARTPRDWQLESVLDASTVEGATIESGTIANVALTGDDVTYDVTGVVRDLDPKRMAPKLVDEPVEFPFDSARVSGLIRVEGAGNVKAELIDHRATFSGTLDGDVDGALLRQVAISGALAARRLTATAAGTALGSWDRLARWQDAGLEPNGTFKLTVTVPDVSAPFGPEFADGSAEFTLDRSKLFGVDLTSAAISATATSGLVTFADSQANGPLGRISLNGTLALAGTGVSDLTYVIDIADLSLLPKQLETAAAGQLHTEGRLTGPFSDPVARGKATGSTLAMNDMSVLHADGQYELRLPEFVFDRITGTASVNGTFIEAGGQSWPRATANATFNAASADVTAVVEHERATIELSAAVTTPAEDVMELTARAFTLRMPGEAWSMAEGSTAVVRMSADRVTVDRMTLVKGDERIALSGALPFTAPAGATQDQMRVEATGVSVAPFITTLLGSERVTGVLNGTAVLTGAIDDLEVNSTFVVSDGAADGVPFRSVGGTLALLRGIGTVDVTLDAAERGTASIKGRAPVDPEAGGLDLTVVAQLADVGVIAPALPYVADASGAGQADLRITGSQASPQVDGTVALTDVRFRVPETGVSYTQLNAGLRITDSVMVVDRFTVADQDGHLLRMTGRLDVLARDSGGDVDLRIVAADFRLLSNQFGDLIVDLDLTAAGTLTAPQMIGMVKVERGRFEVDQLLQQFTPSTAYVGAAVPPPPGAAPAAAPLPPSVFSGAAFSVDVILPDNVVVRGRGLQTDDGPIGLGDVNLTLGGTLQVVKARGAEASLVGQVNVVRGTYDFQGRRFAIERGSSLRFRGDDYTNPTLAITATREVSGVLVRARIQGTAAAPSLTLSSEPSLDEGDILALVVFNRPINELLDAEKATLAARAGSLAAGAIVGPIADSVARALDLDVFEIQAGEFAGGMGATVIVGRQVSDRLFVGFRHEFGGEGANRLSFEYRLTEYLRLMTTFAPGGQPGNRSARTETAGIDLIFVIRR